MAIFDGCLLASDFDGTLAGSDGKINSTVKKEIGRFISNGGFFTVCTGRTYPGFHAYSEEIINAPVLLANGAQAYDYKNKKSAFLLPVKKESMPELQKITAGFEDLGVEVYSADFKTYVINLHRRNIDHFNSQSIKFEIADDFFEEMFPAVKVMISVGRQRVEQFMSFLDELHLTGIKYIPQTGDFIEIISTETDKGAALVKLADYLGVSREKTFAIGDGENDIDMLKAAAFSFSPENGNPRAKSAAGCIVTSNDVSACADAIKYIEKSFT